ncbi:MAG: hypothetical protein IJ092_03200 [Atopobiaceae bacterium]|nr:hypothetical protein [Atopobiaceae bacterium]
MRMTRFTLDDLGGALSWRALLHFVRYLGGESALKREVDPPGEEEQWASGALVAPLLADVIDAINWFNWSFIAANSKKGRKPKRPKPVRRPWLTDEQLGVRRVGRGGIPVQDFDAWWESRMSKARKRSRKRKGA